MERFGTRFCRVAAVESDAMWTHPKEFNAVMWRKTRVPRRAALRASRVKIGPSPPSLARPRRRRSGFFERSVKLHTGESTAVCRHRVMTTLVLAPRVTCAPIQGPGPPSAVRRLHGRWIWSCFSHGRRRPRRDDCCPAVRLSFPPRSRSHLAGFLGEWFHSAAAALSTSEWTGTRPILVSSSPRLLVLSHVLFLLVTTAPRQSVRCTTSGASFDVV